MAVEIPVYVDISGAFDRAVREIPQEMPKIEKVLSRHALNMKIDYGGGGFKTVRNLLTDTTMDAQELEFALKRVRKAFDEAVAKGANKTKTSATVNNLAKAYGLLEQRVKGFYNSNNVAAMRLEDTIAKVSYKINDMKAKLSGLSVGSDQYNKINYELQIQRQRLAELTAQQMKYKAGIDASTSAYQKQSGVVKQLTGYFSGLYAAHTLVRFVRQVRDVTGELEYQRVALGHLLQDEEFGNELFAKTIEAAKESPFRIGQLVTYTKQLAAYRIEQENLFDTTQRLADISAGLGVDMNRLILAYGQVRAASVLRGQELRQFTEAGIPLVELLAEKFRQLGREGTTTADVFKLISERAVPFEYIKEIFEDLTNAGGQFYKMQETQAKTLQGRWEKLKDAYDQALMRVGDTQTFQTMNDQVLSILNGLAKNLNNVVRIVNAGSIAWAAYWLATKSGLSYGTRLASMFIKEYGVVKTLTFGVGGLTVAFKKLWVAMKANWVGLALSAVAGIVTYFTTFKNKTKEANGELSDMQKAIEQMKDANKEFKYGKGLVASYEELAKKTDRTSRESERMLDTINELERTFPGLTDKINNDNLTLEERIGIMREAVNASHDLAVEEAKNRLNTQNEIIRGLEDQEKAARLVKESAQRRLEAAQTAEKVGVVPLSQRYGPGTYDTAEDLKNKTIEAAKAAKAADDAYEDVATSLATARREAEQLRKLAFPEDAKKNMAEWQNLLIDASKYTSEGIQKLLFTDKDVQGWDSLGEAIKKLKPQFKEAKETYEGLVNAVKEGGNLVRPELVKERDAAGDAFDAWKALDVLLGGLLSPKTTTGSDKRLSNLKKDISEITNAYKKFLELRKYMSDSQALNEIGVLFPQLKGWKPSFDATIKKLQEMRDDVASKLARSPKDKTLLEMQRTLDTEISNLKFDDLKKKIDDELKRISDEIKRSETARNFYNDILGLTGDEELATSMSVSVYGGIGDEFKDRIKKQLVGALSSLDSESFAGLDEKIREAFNAGDYEYLMKNLEKVPEELRATVQQVASDSEKFSSEQIRNWIKELANFKTYGEKRVQLAKQTAQKIADINASDLPDEQKKRLASEYQRKEAEEAAKLEYEAFKDTPMYISLFENLDAASTKMLRNMKANLVGLKENWKDLDPTDLKEMQRRIEEIDNQLASKNPFKTIVEGIKAYRDITKGTSRSQIESKAISDQANATAQRALLSTLAEEYEAKKNNATATKEEVAAAKSAMEAQAKVADEAQKTANESHDTATNLKNAAGLIEKGMDGLQKWTDAFSEVGSSVKGLMNEILPEEDAAYFGEQFDNVMGALNGISKAGQNISKLILNPLDLNAWAGAISGVIDTVASIFGASNAAKVKKANEEIKKQEGLINDLEYEYGRLEKAIADSFGTDYIANYNKQLDALYAKEAAYRKQADAERSKGKKADKEKIKEYEDSARSAGDSIKDMESQLSEFFTGTDLTSAAKDFAEAWIEAYKEFGNTTAAMKERFNDMIQNMVVNSLAAQLIQGILKPVFDQIDEAAKDGDLTAQEIGAVSAMLPERLQMIDEAMTGMVNELGAAGINLRQQAGQFTGISRNIAGASEESITGLAAGINTQNFYMQHIDMNVALILSYLTGGTSTGGASITGEVVDPYKDQMLLYAGHIPTIDQNLSDLLVEVRKVIKPKGTTATHYVATNL